MSEWNSHIPDFKNDANSDNNTISETDDSIDITADELVVDISTEEMLAIDDAGNKSEMNTEDMAVDDMLSGSTDSVVLSETAAEESPDDLVVDVTEVSLLDDTESPDFQNVESQNPQNAEVTYFGQRYRTDDNGDLYMRYDDENKKWELLPETKYQSSGYYYETNSDGAITLAGGTLRENTNGRKPLNATVDEMQEGDDRGHLIGDQFDGSSRIDNLIPQPATINRGEYKRFENTLAALRNEGHDVQVVIKPSHSNGSKRPDSLETHLNIDGYLFTESFGNEVNNTINET